MGEGNAKIFGHREDGVHIRGLSVNIIYGWSILLIRISCQSWCLVRDEIEGDLLVINCVAAVGWSELGSRLCLQ